MSIQIDNGEFTRLHNTILDKLAMARLTGSEYRCLMFLFRKTYGWQKKEDTISLPQWVTGTGHAKADRGNVLHILQGLVAKSVIYTKSNGTNRPATYGFNKNWEQWDASLFGETVMSEHNSLDEGVIPEHNNTVIPQHNTTVIPEHNTLAETVMPEHNHKRKVLKKQLKKEKEKPRARSRSGDVHPNTQPIMDAYIEALGYKPSSYGREATAAKQLAKDGYEALDVSAAYALLKQDPFWKTKHLSLQSVASQIPALKQAHLNGVPLARAPTNGNGYMSKGEKQEAAVNEAFRLLEEREAIHQ